ncbi:MAG: hypothetical protein UY48_C0034G0001, partial [Candidatus Gottesmanbacteria bacterium GW2011_GWB1_49_7]
MCNEKTKKEVASLLRKGHLSGHDGVPHLRLKEFGLGHRHQVLRQDGQVGDLAGFYRSFFVFLEGGVRSLDGIRAQRLQTGHRLFRMGPRKGAAVEGLARHGGVEVRDGIGRLHGNVGAVGHVGPRTQQVLPHVGVLCDPFFAQPVDGPGNVGAEVDALHDGDDAELGEPPLVGGVDVLGMLDAEPGVGRRYGVGRKGRLVLVEDLAVGPIADGVCTDLEPRGQRLAAVLTDEFGGHHDLAGVLGVVLVGVKEPRAPGTQGSVGKQLYRADGQKAAARADERPAAEPLLKQVEILAVLPGNQEGIEA